MNIKNFLFLAILHFLTVNFVAAQPGSLDATFGSGGKIVSQNIVRVLNVYSGEQRVDIALQVDGKIVVVGKFNYEFAVFRFNADGTPDATFGTDGIATTDIQGFGSAANAVAIQPDGKIVVAGSTGVPPSGTFHWSDFALARFNPDGSLDTSFGTGGKVVKDISNIDEAKDLVIQPDGKIVFTGYDWRRNGSDVYLTFRLFAMRYNSDGSLDTAFGGGGIAAASFSQGAGFAGGHNSESLTLQPDGKIIVVGRATDFSVSGAAIARFLPNGQPDNSFGTGGKVFTILSGPQSANSFEIKAVALQPDGKIVVAGAFGDLYPWGNPSIPYDFIVLRYTPTGELDNSFDGDGKVVFSIEAGNDIVKDVLIQPNGKIVLAGESSNAIASTSTLTNFAVARLNPNGSLDTSFDGDGKAITDFNNNSVDSISRSFLQPDGKILAVGFTRPNTVSGNNASLALARYIGDAPVAHRPQFDFDGDGKSDISVFRPSNGYWYRFNSSNNSFFAVQFGQSGDKPAPADYDGDGKTDIAVFREGAFGYFYILNSSDNTFRFAQFGTIGDVPVVGDWDGDGRADLAVYRAGANAQTASNFYYRPSSQPSVDYLTVNWGAGGDKPTVGDYDGDGKQDAAIFRPANATWYVRRSSDNQPQSVQFGVSTDVPTPADFDGDGKTNIAVFRPSNGTWYTSQNASTNYGAIVFGANGDVPVPADYDGDGRADAAVFRPSSGAWYLNRTTSGFTVVQFGQAGDKPAPNAFMP